MMSEKVIYGHLDAANRCHLSRKSTTNSYRNFKFVRYILPITKIALLRSKGEMSKTQSDRKLRHRCTIDNEFITTPSFDGFTENSGMWRTS